MKQPMNKNSVINFLNIDFKNVPLITVYQNIQSIVKVFTRKWTMHNSKAVTARCYDDTDQLT